MNMIIIDAKDQIIGRIGAVAAKQALLGEEVAVINVEKAVISGRKEFVFNRYKERRDRGVPMKGPFIPRMPDRFTRRIIRGMLPMANSRGRDAYKRLLCYIGTPKEFEGKQTLQVPGANASKLPTLKKVTIEEICKFLGAHWN
jgi:large subunit ribosomal protein L13